MIRGISRRSKAIGGKVGKANRPFAGWGERSQVGGERESDPVAKEERHRAGAEGYVAILP